MLGSGGQGRMLRDGRRVVTEYTFVEQRSYSGTAHCSDTMYQYKFNYIYIRCYMHMYLFD